MWSRIPDDTLVHLQIVQVPCAHLMRKQALYLQSGHNKH
jgi:hypothetical protein